MAYQAYQAYLAYQAYQAYQYMPMHREVTRARAPPSSPGVWQ